MLVQLTTSLITPSEAHLLQQIGRQTFMDAFAAVNTAENMQQYLDDSFSIEKLTAELSDPNVAYYFARIDDIAVGYLKLNFGAAQTDIKDEHSVEIERIYVLKDYQGNNIGQFLFEKAIEVAKQRKAAYLWLGVWEENPKAIRFYERNGFVKFGEHVFMLGEDRQTDWLMRRELM